MSIEIIYSINEYQEKYNLLLNQFRLEYEEADEVDFINNEIKEYNICLKLINLSIDKFFNFWYRIELGTPLKWVDKSEEEFNFIFEKENYSFYYKIYSDLVDPAHQDHKIENYKRKIKQTRLIFPKIISFLETKKSEIETGASKHDNIFSNNGFELFEHLLKEYIKPKGVTGRQSDLVYYHSKMYDNNPQYIHQKPTAFFKWFDREYRETSGQLMTYDRVKTNQREKDYSTALEWFRLQK